MIEFMRGMRTPVRTMAIPTSPRIRSNRAGYFASRSRIRYLTLTPASSRSIARFLAAWVAHTAVG
jgi:hypothetical protein